MADEHRFWSKVDRTTDDACWPWTAGRYTSGYGAFYLDGKNRLAHVVAFFLATGVWSDWAIGEQVCHHCDNRPCCNPSHLYLGSNRTNALDRYRRGRRSNFDQQTHCKQGHALSGGNLRIYVKRGYTTRRCRTCERQAQQRHRTERGN